ncbi:MAG: MOSC domain-containing protein [Thermoplasmata archaeon]
MDPGISRVTEATPAARVLTDLRIYPVKSLRGVPTREAEVEPWGLRHDRRWLVLDPDGKVLTARDHHTMLSVTAFPQCDGAIQLRSRDRFTLKVCPPLEGVILATSLSRLESVRSAGAGADEWLSRELGRPVRLDWLDDPQRRTVSEAHGGLPGDHLNLSDAGPLLLTARASLRQLNDWAAEDATRRGDLPSAPIVMTRFRPNVVLDGPDEPFAEDNWSSLRIGSVEFRLGERCDRCVLTTIDPDTWIGGEEPLRTLAKHRNWDHHTWFGIRIIPLTTGRIRTGDPVLVAR